MTRTTIALEASSMGGVAVAASYDHKKLPQIFKPRLKLKLLKRDASKQRILEDVIMLLVLLLVNKGLLAAAARAQRNDIPVKHQYLF